MDIDKFLDKLSPEERKTLFEQLKEEHGATSEEASGIEKRLQRLEQAVLRSKGGFSPWQMMSGMPRDMMRFPFSQSSSAVTPTQVFSALADETRLKIINLLSDGEKKVEQLMQALGIAQSSTSHQLRILKNANLVKSRKEGRSVYYFLAHPPEDSDLG